MPEPFNIEDFISRFVEGKLDEKDASILLAAIRRDPAVLETICNNLRVDLLMTWLREFAQSSTDLETSAPDFDRLIDLSRQSPSLSVPAPIQRKTVSSSRQRGKREFRFPFRIVGGLCLLLFVAVLLFEFVPRKSASSSSDAPPAKLIGSAGARWSEGAEFYPKNGPVDAGWLRLSSGSAALELAGGASLVAQSPVEFAVEKDGNIVCKSGTLSFEVASRRKKFQIRLPDATVHVRGTRFSVQASASGSEIHLFEGTVDLEHGSKLETLRGGESCLVLRDGSSKRLAADPSTFTDLNVMRQRVEQSEQEELQRQRRRWSELKKDPSVLAALDFETLDPSWNACESVAGRLPGTRAVAVAQSSGAVDLDIGRNLTSMTLVCRVRVDRLGRHSSVLLLSHPFVPGSVFWQIDTDGAVRLLLPNERIRQPFGSVGIFKPSRLGVWTHLATTVDGEERCVKTYLNGKEVFSESREELPPFRIGRARLGNGEGASQGRRGDDFRLQGAFDDFLIFDRALKPEEILDLISF